MPKKVKGGKKLTRNKALTKVANTTVVKKLPAVQ
jgi:hypothetical protein